MNINIELTDKQVKYLKQFASNQYEGSDDNVWTAKPLHLVQTRVEEYIHDGGGNGEHDVYINTDDYEKKFKSEKDLVIEYGTYDNPDDIVDYETAHMKGFINNIRISDISDYFQAYGIGSIIECCSVIYRYKTVAYFFILENAKKYIKEQSHNLTEPRTYTVHRGYSNEAEYEPFFDLLMNIGTKLNEISDKQS